MFIGYAQDDWVAVQRYQEAPWRELVALWASFNRHLARVMASVPPAVREKPHRQHNLHELAFQPVPEGEPATLDYFMRDYVAHLKHHLRQILGEGWMRGECPSREHVLCDEDDVRRALRESAQDQGNQ